MGVQNGSPKWVSKMGVQNGCPKWVSKMGVQNGGLKVILKCANGANEAQMAQMLLKSANAFALMY
jgi:hypothetical protein